MLTNYMIESGLSFETVIGLNVLDWIVNPCFQNTALIFPRLSVTDSVRAADGG